MRSRRCDSSGRSRSRRSSTRRPRGDGIAGCRPTTLARGEAGGPWAIFSTTYELDGPHAAPYEVEVAGERSSFRIGDAAELQIEPIKNPVSGAEVHPRLLLPEGLLVRDLGLFASSKFRVADGVSYDHSGRYAAVGAFANSGP